MASDKARMSSQMEAVMRLMTGKEERTIAEKMADSNRPTWEQYKKDNEDKLNLSGADHKKMEEYRKELDAERERKMAGRGSEKDTKSKKSKKKKSKHSDGSDDSDSEEERSKRKKHKKKSSKKDKKKRKHHRRRGDSDDNSSYDSSSEEERRRRKKKRKKESKKRRDVSDEEEDDRYKLSSFFTDKGDGGE
jgi:hypothetical protein